MHRLFKYIFAIMAFIWLIPAFAGPVNVPVDKEFSLGIGQSASIDGEKLVIKFKAVLEDSRCPLMRCAYWRVMAKLNSKSSISMEKIKQLS